MLRCEGSVAMVAEAGERAKGEVAERGVFPREPATLSTAANKAGRGVIRPG